MRIIENYFETHYLLTLEGYFYTLFVQNRTQEANTVIWNFINDITTIIERLPSAQKDFFISQIKAQSNSELCFVDKKYKDFQIYFKPYLIEYKNFINSLQDIKPQKAELKTDKLKAELGTYGFFELPKVKELSDPNKQSLIELISLNQMPYGIAMFEYLGFLKHLKAEHFTTNNKLFKAVADWFDIAERAVKGNIYVLNEHSKENRNRYTADKQKQKAENDYEKLK
jgi:hypothetical protein